MHALRTIRGLPAQAILSGVLVGLLAGPAAADWTQTSGPRGGSISAFATVPNPAGGTSLFAGQIRVWRTDDNGATWTHLPNGLVASTAFDLLPLARPAGGHDLLVATQDGVHRSADHGASWSASKAGIPANLSIYALASGSTLSRKYPDGTIVCTVGSSLDEGPTTVLLVATPVGDLERFRYGAR